MDILSINAEAKLMSFASSVGQSPQSWRGWYSLVITLDDLNEDLQHECLFWAKSLLTAYLDSVEGRVYFCENNSIHIVCKNVPIDILEHAGSQICDLAYSESGVQISFRLFHLEQQGDLYTYQTLERHNDIFHRLNHCFEEQDFLKETSLLQDMVKPSVKGKDLERAHTKVLLVEDDPVTRWLVRNALKDNCDLATASSANKAFSLYSSYQPDVVFLDVNLPDKNGYEVLNWVMRNDPGANVVMFSSQDSMDNITQALECGASGFISKPFVKEQLLGYVSQSA